jgi:hypothetical protein
LVNNFFKNPGRCHGIRSDFAIFFFAPIWQKFTHTIAYCAEKIAKIALLKAARWYRNRYWGLRKLCAKVWISSKVMETISN